MEKKFKKGDLVNHLNFKERRLIVIEEIDGVVSTIYENNGVLHLLELNIDELEDCAVEEKTEGIRGNFVRQR